jgi:hypothetical protein
MPISVFPLPMKFCKFSSCHSPEVSTISPCLLKYILVGLKPLREVEAYHKTTSDYTTLFGNSPE